jgi:hypothetical protein
VDLHAAMHAVADGFWPMPAGPCRRPCAPTTRKVTHGLEAGCAMVMSVYQDEMVDAR